MINLTIASGDADLNVRMQPAIRGKSAYDVAVDTGFVGTQADWIAYLYAQAAPAGTAAANTAIAGLAQGTGATSIGYLSTLTGAGLRSVGARLGDQVSILDFTTRSSADVRGLQVFVPAAGATMADRANGSALNAIFYGPGQVTTADGNKRGKWFSTVKLAPTALGNEGSIDTAFNGDWTHSNFGIEHRITGAATLGQPSTGYKYTPEATALYINGFSSSGWNQAADSNDGRTAATLVRVRGFQAGQGDFVCFNASVSVQGSGVQVGATKMTGQPAGSLWNGDIGAAADSVYLNPYEVMHKDNGHDVQCVGGVYNFNRTNATAALFAFWQGIRIQSVGSQPIDVAFGAHGPANIGLDFSFLGLQVAGTYTQAAITLAADQRIYFNATATDVSGNQRFPSALPNDYITYSSGLHAFNFIAAGTSVMQLSGTQVITTKPTNLAQATGGDYLRVIGTTGAPSLNAQGASTDIDLALNTQGAGVVRFGTRTANADAPISGYIAIKDAGGVARKLALIT